VKTPLASILLVVLGSFFGSIGAVFLKFGSEKLKHGIAGILNVRLATGVAMYLLSTVFFVAALRKGELSVLYPLVSTGAIWTLLWSKIFFKEPLTGYKFVGVFLILVGVSFIGLGNR
jgi:multidrug transporter EmrE-like cation transporter